MDGINSSLFNTGITNTNLGQAQGSLAVDGNKVFMATQDGQIWKSTIPTVLPIRLINFSGSSRGKSNILNWRTASEDNTKVYDIERASDALNFTKIGSMKAAGFSTNITTYDFADAQPASISYYRLKEIDLDGTFRYSTVIKVLKGKIDCAIYPTVTSNNITLKSLAEHRIDNVRVFNSRGREISLKAIRAANSLQYDLSDLQAGIYISKFIAMICTQLKGLLSCKLKTYLGCC